MTAFLDLHRPGEPLLIPNAWDAGSARILASLGFRALATTSSGFAATLGRMDGDTTREETLANARAIAEATPLPVSADLENGYAADTDGVAETVRLAIGAGLAGCSIEDWSGERIYPVDEAAARVVAAAGAAGDELAITARAENLIRGVEDVAATIDRLRAYEAAGAHVLYAPGLVALGDVRAATGALSRPVNVLVRPGGPTVAELAGAGVARISVGGAFAFAALDALTVAAREFRDAGTIGFMDPSARGLDAARAAFRDA